MKSLRIAAFFALGTSGCLAQGGNLKIRASSFAEVAPLVIAGGEWTTQLVFTSYRASNVDLTIKFIGQDGKPMVVPLVGRAAVSTLAITVPPQGTTIIETEKPTQSLSGWALTDIPCEGECGDVIGQAILRNHVSSRPDYEAVFPFSERITRHLLMQFDNANGFDTTLILTNAESYSFSKPMTVTIAIYNTAGARIVLDQITVPVAGNMFFSLGAKYSALQGQRGHIDLTVTNGDLAAAGLRINPTNAFTAILAYEP